MAKEAGDNRKQVERKIIAKAATDRAFRQQLISNPRGTLAGELGAALPADVQINVLAETPSSYYLVLPPTGVIPGAELSDSELGAVAGGDGGFLSWSGDTCSSTLACGHGC